MALIEEVGKSLILNLKSENSVRKTSHCDFVCAFGNHRELRNVKRVVLKSIHFLNSQYNINEYNNRIDWNHNSIDYTATISEGQYDVDDLITALESAMNTAMGGATVTITQDSLTNKLSFDWSASTGYIKVVENTMSFTIGMDTERAPADPYVGDAQVRLNGLLQVFINSATLAQNHSLESKSNNEASTGNEILSVPVTAPYMTMNHVITFDDELSSINYGFRGNDLSIIDIQLLDVKGRVCKLKSPVDIVLKIYF